MHTPELDLGLPVVAPAMATAPRRLVRFYLVKYEGRPVQRVKKLRGLAADDRCKSCVAVLQRRNGEVIEEIPVPIRKGKPTVRGFGRRALKLSAAQ